MLLRTLAVLALVLHAQSAVGQAPDESKVVLHGLRSVRFALEDVARAGEAGLDTAGLRVQCERELRPTGILLSDTAHALLSLNVHLLPLPGGSVYTYSYELFLEEPATTLRKPSTLVSGTITWHEGGIAFITRDALDADVRGSAHDLLQVFVNDYLAANPPRR
jgi:hypothetical protein